jgi:hypothetical protein
VRRVIGGIGALVVVVIGVAVASTGHSTESTSSSSAGTGDSGGSSSAASGGSSNTPKTARLGSPVTLLGIEGDEQMSVTATKVITNAQAANQFFTAGAGDRLYAVQFRLSDTGSTAYSDAPTNGAVVRDAAGQSYSASLVDEAVGCASFAVPENVAAGSSGLGCIVFEVPKATKITQVQFTLDSGMGPETGQWDVG